MARRLGQWLAVVGLVLSFASSSQGAAQGQGDGSPRRHGGGMRHSGAWETVLAARAAHMADSSSKHDREPHIWRAALTNTLKQVEQVSWWLGWPDLGGQVEDSAQGTQDGDMMQLVRCVNDKHNPSLEMSWKGAMADEEASVKAVGAWWRNHAPPEVVTVVTSASVSRLPQLYAQCLSWDGPLSVAVYLALQSDGSGRLSALNQAALRTAALQISQFMLDMQQTPRACRPDMLLVYEMYNNEQARHLLYPFNLVRNLARLQARTPLVALVDVDLVLSHSLAKRAQHMYRVQWLKEQAIDNRTVFIIPAFDVRGKHERAAWADALVSSSKEMLVFAMSKGVVVPFQLEAYPVGHHLTNFEHWKAATGDYYVQYEFKCEPWLLGDRVGMPWHDSRYRGYGLDKVQFVMDVAAHGYAFRVMYDTFTIHRAHEKGPARDVFVQGKVNDMQGLQGDKSLYLHNQNLFTQQEQLKNQGKAWTPQRTATTRHCTQVLSWFRRTGVSTMSPAFQGR